MRTFATSWLLVILTAAGAPAQQAADTIVTRGKILTVDAAFHTVEALAIANGRIVAGSSAEIACYAGKNTRVIDVAGATVTPGLIDNHFHFTRGADTWHEQARFEGVDSRHGKLAMAAPRGGWHVHQHVINNNAVTDLFDTPEQMNKTQPLTGLRWTLGHVYDISAANIARAKEVGITLGVHGAAMHAPARMPLRRIADSGIGLGTDATIVSHYTPFVTLGWVGSGLDVGGNKVLDETLTREEALIAHTRSNTYLFFQEKKLVSLEVGTQTDLVVLDRDYMTAPASEIRRIKPTMTMVGRAGGVRRRAALNTSVVIGRLNA